MVLIFYKNLKKHKKTAEKDITFSVFGDGVVSNEDDLISKPNECKYFHNFNLNDGALKTGLGFKDIEVPATEDDLETLHNYDLTMTTITKIKSLDSFKFKDLQEDKIYYHLNIIDQNDKIWICALIDELGFPVGKSDVQLTGLVSSCQYRLEDFDCILYFVDDGMVYSSAYNTELCENVPTLLSCVVHYDKFFGITDTNRNELIYQSNLNLIEYKEEDNSVIEFLDQRGSFNKLVAFNDYVYLFREYGITRISEYSAKDDFSFTHFYTSSSKIYENSICVCGDKVYFCTRDGLHTFNGSSVNKICEEYDSYFKNLDNLNCSSCCQNGKYYLATRCKFDDEVKLGCELEEGYINNVLFEVDMETGKVEILRGVDIKKIISVDIPYFSKVVACFNGLNCNHIGELTHDGKIFNLVNNKVWKSFNTDFGYKGKEKRVKEIILNTEFPCDVEIISDVESKTYSFEGKTFEQRQSANVIGKSFQIVFKTDEQNSHISKPMIVFDVIS